MNRGMPGVAGVVESLATLAGPNNSAWRRQTSRISPISCSAPAALTMRRRRRLSKMAESIPRDRRKVLPCAAYLEGEYGIDRLFAGVPCKIGAGGIEKICEIKLSESETAALHKSAGAVKELVDVISKAPGDTIQPGAWEMQ